MVIDVLTLFPGMFEPVLSESIMKKAQERGLVDIKLHDLRSWTSDKRGSVDDRPFGGGPGMVLKPEPIFKALKDLKREDSYIILLSPSGKRLEQEYLLELKPKSHLILICGHYEDVDERVKEHLIDRELSVGDYILTCGELPAMIVIDSLVRLLPDVLGNQEANESESFKGGLLEYPQYTRPAEFNGWSVPNILLSGDHEEIERWRFKKSLQKTERLRPDLYSKFKKDKKI
jgi:tRNA (guanine37-N1)-methyltransferase